MVTIKDIAREAGVSTAAVSFAMNGTGTISQKTRKRIIEVAERMNYSPNMLAKGLVTQKSSTIGLIMPKPGSRFFSFVDTEVLGGLGLTVAEKGYHLLLGWEDDMEHSRVLELARGGIVQGMLFLLPSDDLPTFRTLNDMKFPYVLMSKPPEQLYCSWVDVDNMDASYHATLALIKAGHQQIGFISPGPMHYLVSIDRLAGYRSALANYGLPVDPAYTYVGQGDIESGAQAWNYFANLPSPPTAILSGTSGEAIGVMDRLRDMPGRELTIKPDIITFENSVLSVQYDITAVSIPTDQIAREAAKLLMRKISQQRRSEPESVIIPSRIIYRKSFALGGQ